MSDALEISDLLYSLDLSEITDLSEISNILNLPLETQYEILLRVPISDLTNTCQTNSLFKDICQSDKYWRDRSKLDYNQTNKPPSISWRDFYMVFHRGRYIPILVNMQNDASTKNYYQISVIYVPNNQSLKDTFRNVTQLFRKIVGNRDLKVQIAIYDTKGKVIIENNNANAADLRNPMSKYATFSFIMINLKLDYGDEIIIKHHFDYKKTIQKILDKTQLSFYKKCVGYTIDNEPLLIRVSTDINNDVNNNNNNYSLCYNRRLLGKTWFKIFTICEANTFGHTRVDFINIISEDVHISIIQDLIHNSASIRKYIDDNIRIVINVLDKSYRFERYILELLHEINYYRKLYTSNDYDNLNPRLKYIVDEISEDDNSIYKDQPYDLNNRESIEKMINDLEIRVPIKYIYDNPLKYSNIIVTLKTYNTDAIRFNLRVQSVNYSSYKNVFNFDNYKKLGIVENYAEIWMRLIYPHNVYFYDSNDNKIETLTFNNEFLISVGGGTTKFTAIRDNDLETYIINNKDLLVRK